MCDCTGRYSGADCSINLDVPPVVLALLNSGTCDVSVSPCSAINVYGQNFLNDPGLTCHLYHVKVKYI